MMFSVRLGPYRLFQGRGTLATIINPTFNVELWDYSPSTSYAPAIAVHPNQRSNLVCYNALDQIQPWNTDPFVI